MLKRIPKSDISIRPFKAYKEWDKLTASASIMIAQEGYYTNTEMIDISDGYLSGSTYNKHSLYGQLRAQFYNGHEDNPFTRTGHKTDYYSKKSKIQERFLSGSAKVVSIPQIYVGEGIKKGSVTLLDNGTRYFDDSYGNIIGDVADRIYIGKIDIENQTINFEDIAENVYSGSLLELDPYTFDIENNILSMSYNGKGYKLHIEEFDVETRRMLATNIPFLDPEAQVIKFGNIFYNQGLMVLTREFSQMLTSNWDLSFKSTKTIYEHEYLLIVNQDEFNVSTHPSAVVNVGKKTDFVTGTDGKIIKVVTDPGVNYIRQLTELSNGNILDYRYHTSHSFEYDTIYGHGTPSSPLFVERWGGFEQAHISSSIDSTGSFLTPMITTIGLYDDDCQLVAVAKLPQPIKSEHDIPVNFIVRFDT